MIIGEIRGFYAPVVLAHEQIKSAKNAISTNEQNQSCEIERQESRILLRKTEIDDY